MSDGFPNDAGNGDGDGDGQPPDAAATLNQARQMAQALLANQGLRAQLPVEVIAALEGLFAPMPTQEQIARGLAAVAAVAPVFQAAETNTLLEGLPKLLKEWYETPHWYASRGWLAARLNELPTDADDQFEAAAARARQRDDDDGASYLQRHAILLSEARRLGVDAAYRAIIGESAFTVEQEPESDLGALNPDEVEALWDMLVEWIQTPDWTASRAYLHAHTDQLLTDGAESVLARLASAQGNDGARRTIAEHQGLLRAARRVGVDAAYDTFLRELPQPTPNALTGDPEIYALLAELSSLNPEREPARMDAVCQRLLALDAERHALSPELRGAVLGTRGDALYALSQWIAGAARLTTLDAAIACYDAALEVRTQATAAPQWAGTQNNKGAALRDKAGLLAGAARLTTLDAAIACYDAALEVRTQATAAPQWAGTQNNKGAALRDKAGLLAGAARLTTLDAAIACYDAALDEYTQATAAPDWAMTQNNKGNALSGKAGLLAGAARLTTLDAAIACFDAALEVYPAEIQPADYRRQAHLLASALLRRALMPEGAGAGRAQALLKAESVTTQAIAVARDLALREPMLSFRQQEWAENARVFALAAALAAIDGRLAAAITYLEEGRARGLAEAAGRRDANLRLLRNPADRQAYVDAVGTVQQFEAWGRAEGNPLALRERASAADAHLKEIVKRLRVAYPAFLPQPDISLGALTAGLAPQEALVYLVPLEAGTLLLATSTTGEPTMRWLGRLTSDAVIALAVQRDEDGLNRRGYLPAALGWRETTRIDEALDTLLPRLGDELMRWVVQQVRALGCHRAVLIAGGFLSVMPLHAATYAPLAGEPATAPDGRRYACDDVTFTYAPSGLTLAAARKTAAQQAQSGPARRAFVAGNPQLTRKGVPWHAKTEFEAASPGYLPYAELEARRVAALAGERIPPFAVTCVTNDQATWWDVSEGLKRYDLAHLSLHAAFNMDQPDLSALLVGFGASLFLRDLLNPDAFQLNRLRLIVLSACQSGLSDFQRNSDEAVGLFGALLAAGAPAVIGTLWSVNDLTTYRLMESFARRAYRGGVAPDAALRAAAREMRGIPDTYATPAETGATLRVEWTVEVTNIVGDTAQAQTTPMRDAIAQALAQQPELAGAKRELAPWQLDELQRQAVTLTTQLQRKPEHPMYWAAFVYYGAPVSLSGFAGAPDDEITLPYRRNTGQPLFTPANNGGGSPMSNDQNGTSDPSAPTDGPQAQDATRDSAALPIAESRAASYFPAAAEVCPRCHAEDYLPIRDARGRDVRQCVSCRLVYAPDIATGGAL